MTTMPARCPLPRSGSEEKDLAGTPAIGDRRVSGIHDCDSRFHLTQPAGTGSKMWDKTPLYVPTGRGRHVNWHRAGPPVEPPARRNRPGGEPEATAKSTREHCELTGTLNGSSEAAVTRQGRRRVRQQVPRTRQVEFTLTDEEYAAIEKAAQLAGQTRGAYVAQVVLAAAANGRPIGDQGSLRQALIELMRAAGLVRGIGTNLHQAVAKLNATGQPSGDLPGYAAESIRRADHIDQVADAVRKALTRRSR